MCSVEMDIEEYILPVSVTLVFFAYNEIINATPTKKKVTNKSYTNPSSMQTQGEFLIFDFLINFIEPK